MAWRAGQQDVIAHQESRHGKALYAAPLTIYAFELDQVYLDESKQLGIDDPQRLREAYVKVELGLIPIGAASPGCRKSIFRQTRRAVSGC